MTPSRDIHGLLESMAVLRATATVAHGIWTHPRGDRTLHVGSVKAAEVEIA